MQPGGESRFAAETADLAKELDENFLGQVLGLSHVTRHPQAERIYAPVVALVKLLEGFHVAFGGPLRQFVVRRSRCLGFACSHWFLSPSSKDARLQPEPIRHRGVFALLT